MGRVLVLLLLGGSTTSAAASSVLVVGENERGREVASELSEVFAKQKVKMKVAGPQAPATSCLFRPASERGRCFSQAGQTAFVDAVLQVGATTAKGRTTVTFQLLSLDDGRVIKREVATGPSNNLSKALAPVVSRLAKLIKPQGGGSKAPEKVEPEKAAPEPVVTAPEPVKTTPVQPDVPKKTVLEPVVVAPPPSIVAPVEPKGSGLTVAAWTTTGLAVAAAGVAGTFGGLGLSARGELDTNEGGVSALSRSQANALAGQANTNFTVALGAGIGAGVLGVVSAILWSQTP
ncbi:MAG: hypothetical protein Q8N26_06445 [Myxococcales bacterium]|nr:hypothetical protein [Myxococcales bacterium]